MGDLLKPNAKGWRREAAVLVLAAILLTSLISLLKYRDGEINYDNSDATWHMLLTIEAYDETPAADHLFLPIVSLGDADDKGISWGSAIPDRKGNYYYTSFSPAGFFLPWLFFKVLHLPVAQRSLYIFNSFLFAISAALWAVFISEVYRDDRNGRLLSIIALLTYVISPELLHGMGITYWHQSIMQVTLILQLFAYRRMTVRGSGAAKLAFYLMALLNPYIEWTGYVANVGFALAELFRGWRSERKVALARCLLLGCLTAASFGLFSLHYMLVVSPRAFLRELRNRFFARNFAASESLVSLFVGYLRSFCFLWALLLLLLLWLVVRDRKIRMRQGLLLFLVCFPLLENLLMKQHAVSYSYDRMKMIFPLSLLICEMARVLLAREEGRKWRTLALLALVILADALNLNAYIGNEAYIWDIGYGTSNAQLAEYIEQEYADSVLACEGVPVRGYMNLLFRRGIYEWTPPETTKEIAAAKEKRYAVTINVESIEECNMYQLGGATVCDLTSDEEWQIEKGPDGAWVSRQQ